MMHLLRGLVFAGIALLAACAPAASTRPATGEPTVILGGGDGDQRIAELGTCVLESGEKIESCRIGYRTFGKLDPAKSNAVLFPTWFTGTTKSLLDRVPDKLVDTKRFYLILVDAIGDGVSSSPSNSRTRPRLAFPKFTIRDMVAAEDRLVREILHIERLHTVMGISMGGMQAYEWAVSRPEAMGRAISIVGTPQLTSQDMFLWNTEMHVLDGASAYARGEYQGRPKIPALQDIHWMMLTTPSHRAAETSRDAFPAWASEIEADTTFDWNDWHRQLEAMLAHDVAAHSGGRLEEAARRVKAKMLVVVADHDQMVNPGPSKIFAKAANAKLVVLDSACGHAAPSCENDKVDASVRAFMLDASP